MTPSVDLNKNVLIFGKRQIRLTPREAEILSVLCAKFGKIVTMSELIERVYSVVETDAAEGVLRVHIFRLRHKRLKGTSLHILPVGREGYTLMQIERDR